MIDVIVAVPESMQKYIEDSLRREQSVGEVYVTDEDSRIVALLSKLKNNTVLLINDRYNGKQDAITLKTAGELMRRFSNLSVVLFTSKRKAECSTEFLREALQRSVYQIVFADDNMANLISVVVHGRSPENAMKYYGVSMELPKQMSAAVSAGDSYFAKTIGSNKRGKLKHAVVPAPSETDRDKTGRRIVGIVGTKHGIGTTTFAMSAAYELVNTAHIPAAYMDLPGTSTSSVYDVIGPKLEDYVPHLPLIAAGEKPSGKNLYHGVEVYCQNSMDMTVSKEDFTDAVAANYMDVTEATTFVDLGTSFALASELHIAKYLTDLIVLTDSDIMESKLDRVTKILERAKNQQIRPVIVLVGTDKLYKDLQSYIVKQLPQSEAKDFLFRNTVELYHLLRSIGLCDIKSKPVRNAEPVVVETEKPIETKPLEAPTETVKEEPKTETVVDVVPQSEPMETAQPPIDFDEPIDVVEDIPEAPMESPKPVQVNPRPVREPIPERKPIPKEEKKPKEKVVEPSQGMLDFAEEYYRKQEQKKDLEKGITPEPIKELPKVQEKKELAPVKQKQQLPAQQRKLPVKESEPSGINPLLLIIGIASVIGLILIFVASKNIRALEKDNLAKTKVISEATVSVLVATHDIKAGDMVTMDDFVIQKMLIDPSQSFVTRVGGTAYALCDIDQGSVVTLHMLYSIDDGSVPEGE